jgi:hypothetical protein
MRRRYRFRRFRWRRGIRSVFGQRIAAIDGRSRCGRAIGEERIDSTICTWCHRPLHCEFGCKDEFMGVVVVVSKMRGRSQFFVVLTLQRIGVTQNKCTLDPYGEYKWLSRHPISQKSFLWHTQQMQDHLIIKDNVCGLLGVAPTFPTIHQNPKSSNRGV